MSEAEDIPQGFKALQRGSSRFLSMLGPLYAKDEGNGVVIGLRIDERHLNTRGVAHGGMLVTLADSALGIVIAMSRTPPHPRAGDWVEARVDVQKMGKRLAFANCHLWIGERRILRASGIFAAVAEK